MAEKPESTLHQLGKYLSLVFLLPSGAVAGYLLGVFLEHYLHWGWLRPAGIILGVIAGLVKLFQELLRDSTRVR
jgi:MFS family permease